MLDTSLSIRYARALFRIAKSLGNAKIVSGELGAIALLIDSAKDLKRVLYHPGITPQEKKQVLAGLLSKTVAPLTLKFMNIIIDKNRIFQITTMAKCLEALLAEDENRMTVRIESFMPLSGETQKKIKERLVSLLDKDISVTAEVQPSLLGGIRLTFGDKVIDGSVLLGLKNMTRMVTTV
jgi:F-type H+-transporting ATPase subunit delta